ncbi:hypothetical protein ACFL12_08115 [Pseudomonadota bacterium]
MPLTSDKDEFWDRVEHELKVKEAMTYNLTALMLRAGMMLVLFTATYLLFAHLLEPSKGYFVSKAEMAIHPIFWALFGVLFIIGGALLRFRAMGPIVEHLKKHGWDD